MQNTVCHRGAPRVAALSAAGTFLRFVLIALILLSAASALLAQQDSTVEWKSALQDLEQRLAENPAASPSALETWRADADALRCSLASFAASHPDLQVPVPAPLGTTSDAGALKAQFDALEAAVDQFIKQTPGNPFNLGVVSVNVTASGVSPEPVADGIDQTQIRNLNITNVAKALDQLTGVSIQHMDIGGVVPIRNHLSIQAGVKNLFDRSYYYTAGYPEAGRTWYLNGRFQF